MHRYNYVNHIALLRPWVTPFQQPIRGGITYCGGAGKWYGILNGMARALSIAEETKVVALLARGDTYAEIQSIMLTEFGRAPRDATLLKVKRRNKDNLAIITAKVMAKQELDVMRIKQKANSHIDKKLDNDELAINAQARLHQQFLDGEITTKEYKQALQAIRTPSYGDLVGVSKEMHAQASEQPVAPTNPEDMAKLAAAIQSGDEVTLSQMVFKRGQRDSPTP